VFDNDGRVASVNVKVELLRTKCFPILSYDLEACPLTKTGYNKQNYAINSSFRKLFNVSSSRLVILDACSI